MVAPVQGSTSNYLSNQDYLTELTNFYDDPKNDGKQVQFVADNGASFNIDSAAYLSKIVADHTKGNLSKKADLSLEGSEHEKAKAKAKDKTEGQAADKPIDADKAVASGNEAMDEGKSSQSKGDESKAQGENAKVSSEAVTAKIEAKKPIAEAKLVKTDEKLSMSTKKNAEDFKKLDASNKKLLATTNATVVKAKASLQKAIEANKAKSQQAEQTLQADATPQSGAKMGFGGKLMTITNGSGGSAAMDQAWEQMIAGKIDVPSAMLKKSEIQIQNAKINGEKAAAAGLARAEGCKVAAQETLGQREGVEDAANGQSLGNYTKIATGAIGIVLGVMKLSAGFTKIVTGLPLVGAIVTAAAGAGLITLGGTSVFGGIVKTTLGAAGIALGIVQENKNKKSEDASISNIEKQADGKMKEAEAAEKEAAKARKEAIQNTVKANNEMVKVVASLNATTQSLKGGLGNSEMGGAGLAPDATEEQIEEVKQARFDAIMAHELEHAANGVAGSPTIVYDAQGVAVAGYCTINVPTIDPSNLEETIKKATLVLEAATAPSDLSSADLDVANQAKDVISKAQSMLEEKAEKAKEKEEKGEEPKKEVKDELKK